LRTSAQSSVHESFADCEHEYALSEGENEPLPENAGAERAVVDAIVVEKWIFN
jgi:hypothetical protein